MSSSDGASGYLLEIYTSDLAKKDAIVLQDKERAVADMTSDSSQSFMKVFTSDLSKQEELVISAKERHANHKRDRFDQQYFVDDLTKDQLESDADELMAGMFVMEFSKDDGMKMTAAINKSLG